MHSHNKESAVEPSRFGRKLAQAAGSLTALALVPAGAQAAVLVYGGASLSVTSGTSVAWDVDGNGTTDFTLTGIPVGVRMQAGVAGNAVVGSNQPVTWTSSGYFYSMDLGYDVIGLGANEVIGPSLSGNRVWYAPSDLFGPVSGLHLGPNRIGLRFHSGADLLYASATLDFLSLSSLTVTGWAWNDTPGGSLTASDQDTGGGSGSGGGSGTGSNQVPEPATLALLALGLGGLRACRARRPRTTH